MCTQQAHRTSQIFDQNPNFRPKWPNDCAFWVHILLTPPAWIKAPSMVKNHISAPWCNSERFRIYLQLCVSEFCQKGFFLNHFCKKTLYFSVFFFLVWIPCVIFSKYPICSSVSNISCLDIILNLLRYTQFVLKSWSVLWIIRIQHVWVSF